MERVKDLVLRSLNIDTRRALGLAPNKLSLNRYIDIPLEWNKMKYIRDTNSIIRYTNNGYISTHILVKDVKQITDTIFQTIPESTLMIYKYNYTTNKGDVVFYPDVSVGLLFNLQ